MAWEELARSLIEEAGLAWNPPAAGASKEVAAGFYDEQLPALMLRAVERLEPAGALPRWDALGVVVIDFEPFDAGNSNGWHGAHFMACSRARQLLAVVCHVDRNNQKLGPLTDTKKPHAR